MMMMIMIKDLVMTDLSLEDGGVTKESFTYYHNKIAKVEASPLANKVFRQNYFTGYQPGLITCI
jgi:hypothetical protein